MSRVHHRTKPSSNFCHPDQTVIAIQLETKLPLPLDSTISISFIKCHIRHMASVKAASAYVHSALITGGTMNLGYNAALESARQKPDWLVVVCSRSDNKAAETIKKTL